MSAVSRFAVNRGHVSLVVLLRSFVSERQFGRRANRHQLLDEHILLDDGYSGPYLDRPALDRLRDLARERTIELVYIHSPDRLARRYVHQVLLMEELERFGCDIVFLEHTPSKDPSSQLLTQIQGAIAEYERAQIVERSRRGKLHHARQGAVVSWKAPYGYEGAARGVFENLLTRNLEPSIVAGIRSQLDYIEARSQFR